MKTTDNDFRIIVQVFEYNVTQFVVVLVVQHFE